MSIREVTLEGRKYVMVPKKQWERMTGSKVAGAESPGKLLKQSPSLADGSFTIEHIRVSLSNKMAARRKALGLTQSQLAKLAHVRVETICRLEKALHMPGVATFDKIDRALRRCEKSRAA